VPPARRLHDDRFMSDTQKTPIVSGGTRPPPTPPARTPGSEPLDASKWSTSSSSRFSESGNQGEGNRTAARRYNEAAEKHAASGTVESAARAARASVEHDEGRLAAAEAAGRAPAGMSLLDKVRGTVNVVRNRVSSLLGSKR
jgi:hypothetical protein